MFMDMAVVVDQQGEMLDDIEAQVLYDSNVTKHNFEHSIMFNDKVHSYLPFRSSARWIMFRRQR